jgi:hypothetical protein
MILNLRGYKMTLEEQIINLQIQLDEAKDILAYYASPNSYRITKTQPDVLQDCGQKARNLLDQWG